MIQVRSPEQIRKVVHIIDPSSKGRAELSYMAISLGYHAEIYGDILDMSDHPPRDGIIILCDDAFAGGPAGSINRLLELGIWLPIVLAGGQPSPGRIVEGIKAGALDYLELPLAQDRLARCLSRISTEAERSTLARRTMIEAKKRISLLTDREREVLQCLSQGNSNKAIARELSISPRTVEIHRSNMMTKLGARHAIEAIRICLDSRHALDGLVVRQSA